MRRLALLLAAVAGAFLLMLGSGTRPAALPLGRAGGSGLDAIVAGAVITQPFGCTPVAMEPFSAACASGHFHTGIDLAAPYGQPVFAAGAGVCEVVRSATGYGIHVLLIHDRSTVSLYGHLSEAVVRTSQLVVAGQQIGRLGSTGMSTGPHVHFEIREAGIPVDPRVWLPVLQGGERSDRNHTH